MDLVKSRLYGVTVVMALVSVPFGTATANPTGTGNQNFLWTTSGLDYFSVESSTTLTSGVFHIGTSLDYAINADPFYNREKSSPQNHGRFNDAAFGAALVAGVGLPFGLELGVGAPYVISHEGQGEDDRGFYEQPGNTEMRASLKSHLYKTKSIGFALIGQGSFNRMIDNPDAGSGFSSVYSVLAAVDTTIGPVTTAINLGYGFRRQGDPVKEFPVEPIGNQFLGSLAANWHFDGIDTALIAELFGAKVDGSVREDSDRTAELAEYTAGLRYNMTTSSSLSFGGGGEIMHGRHTPDWRAFASFNTYLQASGSGQRTFAVEISPKPAPPSVRSSYPKPRIPETTPDGVPTRPADEEVTVSDVLFDFDSDRIKKGGSERILDQFAAYLASKPQIEMVVVEGHTCSIGSEAYNLDLSRRRALSVRRYLRERHGVAEDSLKIAPKGESEPRASNANYIGRQQNRRVVFKLYNKNVTHHH